jgi:hypothetical protein
MVSLAAQSIGNALNARLTDHSILFIAFAEWWIGVGKSLRATNNTTKQGDKKKYKKTVLTYLIFAIGIILILMGSVFAWLTEPALFTFIGKGSYAEYVAAGRPVTWIDTAYFVYFWVGVILLSVSGFCRLSFKNSI